MNFACNRVYTISRTICAISTKKSGEVETPANCFLEFQKEVGFTSSNMDSTDQTTIFSDKLAERDDKIGERLDKMDDR